MDIGQILTPACVLADVKVTTKKDVLRRIAEAGASSLSLEPQIIFDSLLTRERLGTTGLGDGIAIPHARLTGIEAISGVFIRLSEPVDFQSLDQQPVDLVFALLAPAEAGADHLNALVSVSRILRDEKMVTQLRNTNDAQVLYALLTKPARQFAA